MFINEKVNANNNANVFITRDISLLFVEID